MRQRRFRLTAGGRSISARWARRRWWSVAAVAPSPSAPLVEDDFNRPDSTTALGGDWTAAKGTWGIIGGQAYNAGGTADSIAVIDSGATDVSMEAKFNARDDGTGVIVRYEGVNAYYIAVSNGTSTTLYKKDGVSFHNLAGTGTGAAAGDLIRLEARGTRLRVFRNDVLILQASDPSFAASTVVGLRADTATTRFDDAAARGASGSPTFSPGFQTYRDLVLADTPRFFVHGYDSQDFSGNDFHAVHSGSFPLGRVEAPPFVVGDDIEAAYFRGDNWLTINDATRQVTDATWECIFRCPYAATGNGTGSQGFFSDAIFNNGMAPGVFGVGAAGGVWLGNDRSNTWMGIGTNKPFNDDLWHHLVMVWDGTSGVGVVPGQFKIYVDGALVAVTESSYAGDTPPVTVAVETLGYRRGGGQANYIGSMCMWARYDKALTATDVANRWNAIQAAGGLRPGAFVGAALRRVAVQSITSGAFSWDHEEVDTNGFWTSDTDLVVPAGAGGVYLISALGVCSGADLGTERNFLDIQIPAGVTPYRVPYGYQEDRGSNFIVVRLAEGDTIRVVHYWVAARNMTARLHMVKVAD